MPKLAFQAVLVILSHDPFDPRSLRQWRLHKNSNFCTTTCYHGLKVVPSIDCTENKQFPLQSGFVLLSGGCFVNLTFHVRRQPPCGGSGGFACLGSHPGLANCTGASIEGVIVARCTGCSSKRCPCRLSHLGPDLYSKGGCTRITILGQLPAIIVSNGPEQGLCSAKK